MASPFEESQEIDKETIFFDIILSPVGEPGKGITWPFVRRCFFVAFFGTFDDTPSDVGPTVATGTISPESRTTKCLIVKQDVKEVIGLVRL